MKSLEKAWAPSLKSQKRKAKRLAVDAGGEIQNPRPMKRHKLFIVHDFGKPLAVDDDWIGRSNFRPAQLNTEDVYAKSPKTKRPRPGCNFHKLLSDVLKRYCEPFSEDLRRLIKRPADSSDIQDRTLTPPWSEDGKVTLAARALLYLLRGFPVDVASTLIQESEQLGWPSMQFSDANVEMPDIIDQTDVKQDNAISASLPDIKPVIETESLGTFVSDTAHFVEMAALLALKHFLKKHHSWAIALATRPCPTRNDALEILIPIRAPSFASDAGFKEKEEPRSSDKASPPKTTETENPPPDAADGNGCVNTDEPEQSNVKSSAAKLLSYAVTVFLLDEARESLDKRRSAKLCRGVRERIKLVLMDTLEFFCEAKGRERALNSLREMSNVRNLEGKGLDWLLSAPTDNEAFESAKSCYRAGRLHLSEAEEQAEKRVLGGLRLCVRTAKDSIRRSFHSPTIYVREILNKAMEDLDITIPAVRQMPTQQDPLHLVSVREGTGAVETVTRLLDFVCPHWPGTLIGLNSDISSDSPLKPLESKLVDALKERKGCDFIIVDKPTSDAKPPIIPSGIMNMTPLQFEDLVHSYIKIDSPIQREFVDELKQERDTLLSRRKGKLLDSWVSHQDLTTMLSFISGIELLWSRNYRKIGSACQFSGTISDESDNANTPDGDIERVLRARTLMDAEQRQLLDEADSGMQWTDNSPWKNYLVSWGGNWSNLMLTASD